MPYDLNSPLFSDYTFKYRFIKLPGGASMVYQSDDEPLDFPVGTIIAKTFAYPHDQRDLSKGQKLIETRILRKGPTGWDGVSYVWNDEQTEATLKLTGTISPSKWIHTDGTERSNAYIVPNANQCKSCHGPNNNPIGPKPRNLDRNLAASKEPKNQLAHWVSQGCSRFTWMSRPSKHCRPGTMKRPDHYNSVPGLGSISTVLIAISRPAEPVNQGLISATPRLIRHSMAS